MIDDIQFTKLVYIILFLYKLPNLIKKILQIKNYQNKMPKKRRNLHIFLVKFEEIWGLPKLGHLLPKKVRLPVTKGKTFYQIKRYLVTLVRDTPR